MMEDTTGTCDKVVEHTSAVLKLAANRIYAAISKDENIGITALSEAIANELGHEKSFVYGVIGAYVLENPELICAKGKGGGIMPKSKYEALQEKQTAAKEEKTFSKFMVTIREIGMSKEEFAAAKRELGTESPSLASLKAWLAARGSK